MNKNLFDNFLLPAYANFIFSSFFAKKLPNKTKHDNQIFNLFATLQEYKMKYFFFSPARN